VERIKPSESPRKSSGPATYKEILTNNKTAIFHKNYPEDKLADDDKDHILEELGRVFRGSPKKELPHLRSFRLE
jgi:hypothetical protein